MHAMCSLSHFKLDSLASMDVLFYGIISQIRFYYKDIYYMYSGRNLITTSVSFFRIQNTKVCCVCVCVERAHGMHGRTINDLLYNSDYCSLCVTWSTGNTNAIRRQWHREADYLLVNWSPRQ